MPTLPFNTAVAGIARHSSRRMAQTHSVLQFALVAFVLGLVCVPQCDAQLKTEKYKIGQGEERCLPGVPYIYTGHKGKLSDGSDFQHPYSGNRNCRFIIDTEISGPIRITFNRFDTEKNRDLLIIYDGPDEFKDNEIARLSGKDLPETILTPLRNQTRILLRWFTDGNNAGAVHHFGWEFSWAAPLCRSVEPELTIPYGQVTHGMTGFAQTYGPNSNCTWFGDFSSLPDPPPGTAKARFWITRMSLGDGERLQFFAGPSIYSELAAELVGPLTFMEALQGQLVEVFSDKVLVLFQSDNNGPEMGGFDFYWPAPHCNYLTTMTTTSGKISDGSPQDVPYVAGGPYHACNWNFNTIPSRPFILSFYYFGIWDGGDVLNVYSGHAAPSADGRDERTLYKTVTGLDRPESIKVSYNPSGAYSLELLMDHRKILPPYPQDPQKFIGFGAAWDSAYCHASDFKIDPGVHTITDGSPIGVYYEPNTSCSWLIDPPYGGPIRLKFDSIRIRRFYDFVWVYGGNDTNAPLLAEMSGDHFNHTAAFPVDFDVFGDYASIFIKFQTSEEKGPITIPQYGFKATWSAPYCGKVGAGMVLTEPRGLFRDGSGDESYIPRSHCIWQIRPGYPGIRLILWKMKVRSGKDFIRVYEGEEPTPRAMIAEWSIQDHYEPNYCTKKPLYSVSAEGPVMLVEFVSADGGLFDPEMDGWEMEYTPTSRCSQRPVVLTEPRGVITDGSEVDLPYAPFTNCTWVIAPEAGLGPVTVTIEDMVTNANFDILSIYGGSDPDNLVLLEKFSGNFDMENYNLDLLSVTSKNATYNWDAITLKFTSDCGSARTDLQRGGWRLRWDRFTYPPPSPSPPPPPPPPPKRSPPPPPPPPPRPPPPPPSPAPPPPPLPPFPDSPLPPPPPTPQVPSPPTPLSINPFDLVSPPSPDEEGNKEMSRQTLIGIVVALSVVAVLAIFVITVACCWLKKEPQRPATPEEERTALFSPSSSRRITATSKNLLDLEAIEDVRDVKILDMESMGESGNSPESSRRSTSPDARVLLISPEKNQKLTIHPGVDRGEDELLQWTPPGTPDASPTRKKGAERPIWDMQSVTPSGEITSTANPMIDCNNSPLASPRGSNKNMQLELAVQPMWPPAPPPDQYSPPRSPYGNKKLMRVRSVSRTDLLERPLTPPVSPDAVRRPSSPSAGAKRPSSGTAALAARGPDEIRPATAEVLPRSPLADEARPSSSPAPLISIPRRNSWRPPSSTPLAKTSKAQNGEAQVGWGDDTEQQ